MGHFSDSLRALAVSLTNAFRAPVTVQYPKVIRPRAERYRSSFALLMDDQGDEACIGCLACERICPSKVISIVGPAKRESKVTGKKRGYADDFTLDLSACIFCELCVQVCPDDAIVMTRQPQTPTYGREDLVLTMPKLYANGRDTPRAWSDGTKLMEMQTPPKAPKPPAPAAAEPRPAAPAVATGAPVGGSDTAAAGTPRPAAERPAPVVEGGAAP